ncbi:AT-rich interactive domain-containing protein 6-like [Bidens hawaiensis]|uniref:AT-rich interactive domain-containing protein 6-like n=1 Tax=Bidens hawaiensis TaxID=980011 RepID=UPI00404A3E36
MAQREFEMEDAGKDLEDEVIGVEHVEDKQQASLGLVDTLLDEIGIEQEGASKKDEEEMQANKIEQESPVDEVCDGEKDASTMGNDKIDDSMNDDHDDSMKTPKINNEEDEKHQELVEHSPNKAEEDMQVNKIEQESRVDEVHDGENDASAMGDDKIDDSMNDSHDDSMKMPENNNEGHEKHQQLVEHSPNKAEEEMQVNKIEQESRVGEVHDGENDASMMGDDKIDGVYMDDDHDGTMKMPDNNNEAGEKHQELAEYTPVKAEDHNTETLKNELQDTKMDEAYESGTEEDQEIFMKELEALYKEKNLEFKPPKFYGQPLNCLKLWRSVIKLGGYDRVTGSKLWRYIGEAFNPPKTCTTVSYTFRQFYEKALLEYERHKVQIGELEFPLATLFPEAPILENEANSHQTPGSGSGPGRARRDAAARAMQGWHAQRLSGFGEEKNSNSSQKRERSLKSIVSLKQKRPSEVEHSVKAARTETSRQAVSTVADVGPPADWVKINVLVTKDCFEVYALVPGLLREEVRVQSDPAGRLVITGQPEQLDNPWGITPFKKVISLPSRIDPLRTSAIVSLHGRLLVRVPFEQSSF